ncbi:NAD(P)/FAD-dependent oxidoreductase [Microvirga massiliensis]|uniref:NAD(P)/FAD-dependent oxidoreductase n=1 Tax=Microvirga massiliensis TaxID=1033741 RepID=UPI00062B9871|nr:NAD(P)/FAD-dependent oxidoreductase [Microvirga massiliensis]
MQPWRPNRRAFLGTLSGLALGSLARRSFAQSSARVVVVGGGFAGATCARELQRTGLEVVLIEASPTYVACPLSNLVLASLRDLRSQEFGFDALRQQGITIVQETAERVEPAARRIFLSDGSDLSYDRLVLAPGIDLRFDALPGYDRAAAENMPHAWKAGPQTELLHAHLREMQDGGTVVMSVPPNPYRCPPGPYERASLIAHYLKTHKPRSKILVLDAKDMFSKQRLFQAAWRKLYPDLLEYVPLAEGGKVVSVDPASKTVTTDFGEYKADVANIIPPQQAGRIAHVAGVADRTGWCPIDPVTFESTLQRNIHVIGDAAIGGAMPKSAFTANAQAKCCAAAVASLIRGEQPPAPKLINTCYSLVAPDYGISVAGIYHPANGLLSEVAGAGGISPLDAPDSFRALEATYAMAWFDTITHEVFG